MIVLLDLVLTGAAVVWLVMYPGAAGVVAVGLMAGGGGIAMLAVGAFRGLWRPMLAPFPACAPAEDAVSRRFQSIGLGIVNMGASVHITADEDYLHLVPLRIWQLLGASPASIPWSAMEPEGTSGRVVRVNGHRLVGPAWCISLAAPFGDADEP